jgi:peptidoglycan/xylan/chitin deacetylase (PgdA/CDA1 family)
MWDVLSADFDTTITKEKCLQNVLKNTKKGSVIVFHDSVKAFERLQYTLPKVLEYYSKKGYVFKAIS